ncbi:MAG: enoyl-CoA hydratase-related protein, partial [Deltaproteobacteria bacterium]
MNPTTPLSHWRLEQSQEIAWLTLDVAGASANTLSRAVLEEFEFLLQDLERAPYRGLVIRSGKAGGFIAGADVNEFRALNGAVEATQLARRGQQAFDRLARLPFPTVALIHGYCLGGGLELALACRYRIAREDDAVQGSTSAVGAGSAGAAGTRLGLPEVKLGIHPGFGGTVRLPPLVGDLPALDLMLTGRTLGARAARKLGLVDELVTERHLVHAAQGFIARPPARRRPSLLRRLPGFKPLRPLVAALLARKLRSKADPEHYPAPWRILELWR